MSTWKISGEYFENCNCDVLCPCLTSHLQAKPTQGHCDVIFAFRINKGEFNGLKLDDLNVVVTIYTPEAMGLGNWKVALYLDERATPEQQKALGAIFSGEAGGPMAAFSSLISENLGVRVVPITFEADAMKRKVRVEGILDSAVEGIPGTDEKSPMMVTNAPHPANSSLAIAKSTSGHYKDYGMVWDNTGKNGHYAPINWEV